MKPHIEPMTGLLSEPRRRRILDWLQEEGSARVRDLAAAFQVSEATIRQDLERLEAEGVITREHGGAFLNSIPVQVGTMTLHHQENMEKKRRIGALAAAQVGDGETLILDAGSTTTGICRSPTAEAVLRAKLDAAGLAKRVAVDSAGTGSWHIGSPPDPRSQRHAEKRGYDLSALRGRQVAGADFHHFDLILAMDEDNLADLQRLAPEGSYRAEVRLFAHVEVPDPYAGGPAGFERVLDLLESAGDTWVKNLVERLGTS